MNVNVEAEVSHFKELLLRQIERADAMKQSAGALDLKQMPVITIGLVPGDGIGPRIFESARRVLEKLLKEPIRTGRIVLKDIFGLTIENRLKTGEPVPKDVLDEILKCPVLLKGPTTTPHGGTLESANVFLRRTLDLYANIRPVRMESEHIDWCFFRENTEGEYALGSQGIAVDDALAMDFKVTTVAGTERIARAAFRYAAANHKTRVSVVTKANVMKQTDGLFSRIAHRVAEEFPGIECDDFYIDIMTANLLDPKIRSGFQVLLLPNLYGDILTDEAAEIQGGVGTAGSANLGDRYAMFEAIHGSAPRMIEEGRLDYANPASILTASSMLLNHIGETDAANRLTNALDACRQDASVRITGYNDGATTEAFTEAVISRL